VCVRSTDVVRLCGELAGERIVTSYRDDALRVSLHLYNTEDDVERLVAALAARRGLLA
jgi:selenocysteine lyase/cysteine desulfurase